MTEKKKCSYCKTFKPLTEFHKTSNGDGKTRLRGECGPCRTAKGHNKTSERTPELRAAEGKVQKEAYYKARANGATPKEAKKISNSAPIGGIAAKLRAQGIPTTVAMREREELKQANTGKAVSRYKVDDIWDRAITELEEVEFPPSAPNALTIIHLRYRNHTSVQETARILDISRVSLREQESLILKTAFKERGDLVSSINALSDISR